MLNPKLVAQRKALTLLTLSMLKESSLRIAREHEVKEISKMLPAAFNGMCDMDVLTKRLSELKKEESDAIKRSEEIEKEFDTVMPQEVKPPHSILEAIVSEMFGDGAVAAKKRTRKSANVPAATESVEK